MNFLSLFVLIPLLMMAGLALVKRDETDTIAVAVIGSVVASCYSPLSY